METRRAQAINTFLVAAMDALASIERYTLDKPTQDALFKAETNIAYAGTCLDPKDVERKEEG